jgi:hypothetical protein
MQQRDVAKQNKIAAAIPNESQHRVMSNVDAAT